MAEDNSLLTAAGRIADGEQIDWGSITATLPSEEDRAIAEELAVVAQIAAGHRQLHQLLPVAADTPPNLMPDRARWGHLDLLNIVGRGSYGIVYRAWDTRLERLVALKLFHGASNPDAVMQEGRMLARVRHENVVTVYGADVIDGVAGIWMELVHGRTVDNLVKGQGPMPAREAAAVGADIARALGAVHAAGLLHCDVKAQNVVRESGGRVVLMDLGAGRLVPEARDTDDLSDVAGTPRYMAPELFAAGAIATRASDIYSLGVLLYFVVSGKFPVDGKTLGELRRAHQEGKPRPLGEVRRGLPAAFVELVSKAIDRDPEQRPGSAADVQAALTPLTSAPVDAPSTRSAWWWAAVPTLAVLALAAFLWSTRSSTPAAALPLPNTLAVMPIRNLTGDPSKQFLADGLTELLIAHLARVRGLEVASSASVATLRGTTDDERLIADKLGVRLMLAGAVMQADNRVRLSLTLNDPYARRSIWGTELERTVDTILTARSEIARLIAARFSLPAAPIRQALTLKPDSQELFIRGVVDLSSGMPARVDAAVQHFERAAALEATWAEPLAYLAYAQQIASEFADPAERPVRAEVIRENALRAMDLDPSEPLSYAALAAVQAYHDWDFIGAEATLRQGIELAPHIGSTRWRLALLLAARNRLPEAVAEAVQARDLEPLLPERHGGLGMIRYYARDFDGALQDARRALAIAPNTAPPLFAIGRILAVTGRVDEGIESVQAAIDATGNQYPAYLLELAYAHSLAGRAQQATAIVDQVHALEAKARFVSIDNYAYIAGNLGRLDDAFALLDEAVRRRMTSVLWLAVDPRADPLRADPRFEQLIARMRVVANAQ